MRERHTVAVGVALLALSLALPRTSRASSTGLLTPGTKVRVTVVEGSEARESPDDEQTKRLVGRIAALDLETLTIKSSGDEPIVIPRRSVRLLEVRTGSSRGRSAAIGAGIGAAVGLGIALVEYAQCKGEWLCETAFGLPVLTAPAGALVGLVVGGDKWTRTPIGRPAVTIVPTRGGVYAACSFSF